MKGSNSLKLVQYLLDPDKQRAGQRLQADTNMFATTVEEFGEEFRFSHTLNPRVKQTMAHYSVSLSPGEQVDPTTRHAITKRVLELTGHGDCQYLSAEHFDQAHKNEVQHWHIATSTVDLDGLCIDDDFIRVRLRQIEQQLEQEFSLVQPPVRPIKERDNLPTGEYRRKKRTGEVLPREKLWDTIQKSAADSPSMLTLTARLKAKGIGIRFRQHEDQIQGISYEIEGWKCSGYKLGDAYSFNGLQQHLGVVYQPNQTLQLLHLQQMSAQQCRKWLESQEEEEQKKRKQQEQQEKRKHYRSLYERYSPAPPLNQPFDQPSNRVYHDIAVAVQAFQDRQLPQDVLLIVANGVNAQELKQKQGEEAAVRYAHQIRQHAQLKLEELQKQQDKKRKQNPGR